MQLSPHGSRRPQSPTAATARIAGDTLATTVFAADTAAATAVQLMHRKPLTIETGMQKEQAKIQWLSFPLGSWSAVRNVLTSSPSPHTVIPENRLNHLPFGTSGWVSSQSASAPSWSDEISRDLMRSSRWFNNVGGRFCRRILGIVVPTVESANDRFANFGCFHRIGSLDHSLCQLRQFVSGQMSLGVELIRKPNHAQLFFRIEPFDFLDDLIGGHNQKLC